MSELTVEREDKSEFAYWWEVVLLGILVLEVVLLYFHFPKLLQPKVFLSSTINYMEMGIVALAMAFVIISKNIDISVASIIALVSVVLAACTWNGFPLWMGIGLGLVAGVAGGLFNGVLITKMKIPALVVTLGTMSLYRGAAYVVTGDQTFSKYPPSFSFLGRGTVLHMPFPLVVFIVLFAITWFLLHRTTFGRKVYAIGSNKTAAFYSGIKVDRVLVTVFSLTGLFAAIAGIIMTSRNNSTRGNMAQGLELDAITMVVLGGVSMDGGKGNLLGVVMAVFIIGIFRTGMYAMNVSSELMRIFIGCLLIFSLLVPKLASRLWKK